MNSASLLETIPLLKTQFDWANLIFHFTFKSARPFFFILLSGFCLCGVQLTLIIACNYYTLQENDELLEAVGRKLSRLTSYDAQKRLDHCSKRGEPRKTSFLSYPDLITAHQLIFCNAETLHNTLHPLLRSGLFSLTQQFISVNAQRCERQDIIIIVISCFNFFKTLFLNEHYQFLQKRNMKAYSNFCIRRQQSFIDGWFMLVHM
ncbi:hypothetical protein T02_11890 [Trichinella nativa]|uniref:Uncharacterized protein n=1 Tax=Trichinella nativa TaxID=6335 RepID=A0A0V1KVH3_9BILA|nr:hypothetical protein T02_11890 [Trichinella nativa]